MRFCQLCIIIDHFSAFEFELVALFLTLSLKHDWQWVKTARNLNLGVSRNRFCDFLADPDSDSRSFSRFGAIIMQFAVVSFACLRVPEAYCRGESSHLSTETLTASAV